MRKALFQRELWSHSDPRPRDKYSHLFKVLFLHLGKQDCGRCRVHRHRVGRCNKKRSDWAAEPEFLLRFCPKWGGLGKVTLPLCTLVYSSIT